MKKNKQKTQIKSKASRTRRAACGANQEIPKPGDSPGLVNQCDVSELGEYPQINEITHTSAVEDLGSVGLPGVVSASLMSYAVSLQLRLLQGEEVQPNVFLHFGFTFDPREEWTDSTPIHSMCGTNIPVMMLVAHTELVHRMVLDIERTIRDIVARLNEESNESISTVLLVARETAEPLDPASIFDDADHPMETENRIQD